MVLGCDFEPRMWQVRSTPILIDKDGQFSSRRSVFISRHSDILHQLKLTVTKYGIRLKVALKANQLILLSLSTV